MSTLSRIETGKCRPKYDTALDIAEILDMPAEWLLMPADWFDAMDVCANPERMARQLAVAQKRLVSLSEAELRQARNTPVSPMLHARSS